MIIMVTYGGMGNDKICLCMTVVLPVASSCSMCCLPPTLPTAHTRSLFSYHCLLSLSGSSYHHLHFPRTFLSLCKIISHWNPYLLNFKWHKIFFGRIISFVYGCFSLGSSLIKFKEIKTNLFIIMTNWFIVLTGSCQVFTSIK